MKQVVIIGPESTGKTTLTQQLARFYHTLWIPEFAREYVENLNRPYNYDDVVKIAEKQVDVQNQYLKKSNTFLFIDTDLIITKIWFDVVYKKHPDWIDSQIKNFNADLYLLCNTDVEWIPDPVRENGGQMREYLFNLYLQEIKNFGFNYRIVSGINNRRLENAIIHIKELFEI